MPFDELGRFQFTRLCRELLASELSVHESDWRDVGGAQTAVLLHGARLPGLERSLEGPVLVIAAWVRRGEDALRMIVERELADSRPGSVRSVLALTNVDAADWSVADVDVVVAGRRLAGLVAASPRTRLGLPTVLDASLLDADARSRSTADVEGALSLARVFVPTRAYAATLTVLERHSFAVLTGPPEMGKTAIAKMVGLAQLSNGWELHECVRPEQLWSRFDEGRAQVFVADDAFGSTEYRAGAAEHWAVELDRILRAMDTRHWLLWTSRPAPLKAGLRRVHREHGVERFPQPAQVHVDAGALEVEEKALILFRHAKGARLPTRARDALRLHGWDVVSHPHFTPERIRRFVTNRLLEPELLGTLEQTQVETIISVEIREPTEAMAASFRALGPEHRAVLVAMLDLPAGTASERDVAAAVRRHSAHGFAAQPAMLLDRLTDHFVRIGEAGSITWVHPSWRDLVIDELGGDGDTRRAFLRACTLEGILLALSTSGGSAGGRSLPLLLEDADWDAVADRLASLELDEPATSRLLAALEEAVVQTNDGRRVELDALAAYSLDLMVRHRSPQEPIPIGLVTRWLELRSTLPDPPALPDLTATWIELVPSSRTAATDVWDWLTLVEALSDHASEALLDLGFPERQLAGLSDFIEAVAGGSKSDVPAAIRTLNRIAQLVPALADEARDAADDLPVAGPPLEWYVPRELSAETQALLEAPLTREPPDRLLVARVLRDL